jgi:hypothetical protein
MDHSRRADNRRGQQHPINSVPPISRGPNRALGARRRTKIRGYRNAFAIVMTFRVDQLLNCRFVAIDTDNIAATLPELLYRNDSKAPGRAGYDNPWTVFGHFINSPNLFSADR